MHYMQGVAAVMQMQFDLVASPLNSVQRSVKSTIFRSSAMNFDVFALVH